MTVNKFYLLKITDIFLVLLVFSLASCANTTSEGFLIPNTWTKNTSKPENIQYTREQMDGVASWYGPNFHGKKTANGEIYNQNHYTVAHKIIPINSRIKITNLENGKIVFARVNDRGPYKKKRIVDVSKKIAKELGFFQQGKTKVRLDIVYYPKNYNHKLGITPYKQKVVQVVAYKNKQSIITNLSKIKSKLYPIPIFIDQPTAQEYHVVVGPFYSSKKAQSVSKIIQKKGFASFVRSYRK